MNVNNYVEIISLLIALIFCKNLSRYPFFVYFIPFLAITCIIEIYAIGKDRQFKNMMYNYFQVFEFLFYALLFYHNLELPKLKKIVKFFFPFYIICFITNQLFGQGIYEYNRYTSLLGAFFMVVFVCFFFYETILPSTTQIKLFQMPFFWVTVGLLFFYLGSVIIYAMYEYLSNNHFQKQSLMIFQVIISSLNVILYGSFSIAFILCRNKKTSLLQS
jgi:hypothetical protein